MKLQAFAKQVAGIMPQIFTELMKRRSSQFAKSELTFSQMMIITLLIQRKECNMGYIAHAMKVTMSAVTGLTDRMIRLGLLERSRSTEDRRIVKIRLTKKGVNVFGKLQRERIGMISTLFSNITQRERAQYLRILKKLQKNIHIRRGHK